MARRRARLNLFDKIILGIIAFALVIVVVGGIVVGIQSSIQASEDAAYTKIMAPALENVKASQVAGDKAVSFMKDTETYTKTYVPEEFATDDPEEVRYVVTVENGSAAVGRYGNGGIGLQRYYKVEIKDLKTGAVIETNTFYGGQPPQSVKSGGNHYGSYPSDSKVVQWVADVLAAQ